MKIKTFWAATIFAAIALQSFAQPNMVIVTNYVTVVVTNIVTVTNIVPPAPPTAAAAVAAQMPPAPVIAAKFPWQSSVSVGLSLARGNSDTTLFTADFLTQKKTPFDEYKIGFGGAYGSQDSRDTVNNYKALSQWNHLFTERVFSYARVEGSRDVIADVDYRVNIGPGAGYYLVKQTNTTLAVEAGGSFEAQKLDDQDDKTFATFRLAERFEHKVNDHVRIWQNVEFLPQVDEFDNYLLNFEVGMEASISKSFSIKTYLDDNYNNHPAPEKLKNDAKLIAALGYKF